MKTDREQLEELMSAYGLAIDAKNYDGVAACFMPDAIVEYFGYSQALTGHKDIVAFMRKALDPLDGTHHLFSNFITNIDGDSGDFSCGLLAQHWRTGAPGGDTYLLGGTYQVHARRIARKWKFARFAFRGLWASGNRSLVPQA